LSLGRYIYIVIGKKSYGGCEGFIFDGLFLGLRVDVMVREGKGRLFRRKDGKFLIYLPKNLAEDSMFPFKEYHRSKRGGSDCVFVKVTFETGKNPKLFVEDWK
jgi:hypothetical protein